ncbi:MAG: hypothetical protein SFV15_04785 [Polyangiaceae bacterium]|nr:hypothetical protein [Polyangiaceae bacterium]
MSAIASARPALVRFRRGATHALDDAEALLGAEPVHEAKAFRLAFAATQNLYGVTTAPLPLLEDAQGLLEASLSTADGIAELCRVMSRISLLGFDLGSMARWHELHSSLVSNSSEQYAWYRATALWLDLMQGRPAMAQEAQDQLAAFDDALPVELKVELLTLCALGALLLNHPETALTYIDSATELAKAESLVEWRLLTTLARCRVLRYLGRPLLASLFLNKLSAEAPPAFGAWIAWEKALADGSLEPELKDAAPDSSRRGISVATNGAWVAVNELSALLHAARVSSERIQSAREALSHTLTGVRPMLYEVQLLAGSLDYQQPPPKNLRSWCWGQDPLPPGGLHSAGTEAGASTAPTSFAILQRGHVGRRVLACALPSTVVGFGKDWIQVSGQTLPQTALSALALADHAELSHAELFRQSYGIEYIRRVHQALLTALLDRTEQLLGDHGTLTRRAHSVSLTVHAEALVVFDPRTARPICERVLSQLVASESGTLEQLSAQLSLPPRLVGLALAELVTLGAAVRVGIHNAELFSLSPELEPDEPASLARPKPLKSEPPSRRTGT